MHWITPLLVCLQASPLPQFGPALGITAPRNARTPVRIDPVEHHFLLNPGTVPKVGETIGDAKWTAMPQAEPGKFAGDALRGGYVFSTVQSSKDQVFYLEARGHSLVYVNGEPRGGDPYDYGWLSLPVQLRAGSNHFLFVGGRGSLSARFAPVEKPLSFHVPDMTLPDAIEGQSEVAWGAVVVRNATPNAAVDYEIETISRKSGKRTTPGWIIESLTIRKVGFELALDGSDSYTLNLKQNKKVVDSVKVNVRVRKAGEPFKVTFKSDIDGSIQYYGVNPSSQPGPGQALFLSLHGASVEAIGQAEAYAPKKWGYVIAPTNRRPFGFDWEDTGRHDAMEVLALALSRFETDPSRTYLTGHSMGGHGTWQLGAHFPSRFAAIAPSAGWISFWTYAGGASYPEPNAVEKVLLRAMSPSDTLALKSNYNQQGIYIVHGDADDNVPVAQARTMRKELEGFHKDFQWHEQPGAGHWWESSPERGAECVDWPGIFQLFARRRIPSMAEVTEIDFSTASPGVSAECQWVTVLQQDEPLMTSRVQLKAEPWSRTIVGTTQNVKAMDLYFDSLQSGGEVTLKLDGTTINKVQNSRVGVTVVRDSSGWKVIKLLHPDNKNPNRYGGFKDIFRNNVALVYGTGGTPEVKAWSLAKARFDAESWYYRANGSFDVVPDTKNEYFKDHNRNVVLYGNGNTNRAMRTMARSSMIPVSATVGSLMENRINESLALFAIQPRLGSKTASVASIGGMGLTGMRLSDRVPIFVSGASLPDFLVLHPDSLLHGTKKGVLAGLFNMEWQADLNAMGSTIAP